jgi:hypothetical protein
MQQQENTIFETETIIVFHNDEGILIKNKSSNRTLWVGDVGNELTITCLNGLLTLKSSGVTTTPRRTNG